MTAKEFCNKGEYFTDNYAQDNYGKLAWQYFESKMIEFAKHHVVLALEEASEKAMIETDDYGMRFVNEDSITDAYPLSNIQ